MVSGESICTTGKYRITINIIGRDNVNPTRSSGVSGVVEPQRVVGGDIGIDIEGADTVGMSADDGVGQHQGGTASSQPGTPSVIGDGVVGQRT